MNSIVSKSELQSISINENTDIKIAINNDPNRVISFDPTDLVFVKKIYNLLEYYEKSEAEYLEKAKEVDKIEGCREIKYLDPDGNEAVGKIANNAGNALDLMTEMCNDLNAHIDDIFGAGTAKKAFDGRMNIEGNNNQYTQFFKGIMPFIEKARKEKTNKYTTDNSKVMS